jgi:hypothetical protein
MSTEVKFKHCDNTSKVRWAVKDTSIVTEEEYNIIGTFFPCKGQLSIAHNVGKSVAHRVVKLHNDDLAVRTAIASGTSDE